MEIELETTVTDVVVYPDRARVTSRGHCQLTEGLHRIVAEELPLALMPESVRAGGQGTGRVRLRSVDVQYRHYTQAPAENVLALEAQIQRVLDELKELEDRAAIKQASVDHLEGMRQATSEYATGLARGRSTIENQIALIRFFEDEETRLRDELRDLGESQRVRKDELAKLQAELNQIHSARPRQRYEVSLEVEALSAGDFQVELTYVVNRAGWRPLYDMRLRETDAGSMVNVTSLAEITQDTGQDWTGVRLAVSTARPALNQRVPEINPWYIDELRLQPRMVKAQTFAKAARMEAMDVAEEVAMPMAMAAPVPIAAETEVAVVEDSGTAVTFVVSGNVDIPGDGTPKKITIGQNDLPPKLDFLAVPRHTDAVFRRAKLTNTTGTPLLAGPVSLYVGEEYIGQNRLDYTPGGGEIELVLGVEERITVKREMVRRDVDKRLLRDQRQIVYGYEIKLENLLSSSAHVMVKDQYPVSRHDQIKVRLDNVSPEPVERTELNILEWELELAAAEKKTIQYEYQVEHPKAMTVAGLID